MPEHPILFGGPAKNVYFSFSAPLKLFVAHRRTKNAAEHNNVEVAHEVLSACLSAQP
ncbi:hypothetical protein MUP79_02265 [Candidatus Bathyarchaeota archaeon]|nr:hypothetical protein [Candidatus Bathyarchaeota archaeon]